jgi:hypothetical protein
MPWLTTAMIWPRSGPGATYAEGGGGTAGLGRRGGMRGGWAAEVPPSRCVGRRTGWAWGAARRAQGGPMGGRRCAGGGGEAGRAVAAMGDWRWLAVGRAAQKAEFQTAASGARHGWGNPFDHYSTTL